MVDVDTSLKYPLGRYCKFCGKRMRMINNEWMCSFFFCEMKEQTIEIEEESEW
jgi:hypothetical protein